MRLPIGQTAEGRTKRSKLSSSFLAGDIYYDSFSVVSETGGGLLASTGQSDEGLSRIAEIITVEGPGKNPPGSEGTRKRESSRTDAPQ